MPPRAYFSGVTEFNDRRALDHVRVAQLLVDIGWPGPVPVIVQATQSTNADVAELASAGAPEGTCVVAEEQKAGRGRLGRDWSSPPYAGLWMSVLVRPGDIPRSRWTWLPLIAGLAAHDSMRLLEHIPVALKWPNDLVFGVDSQAAAPRKLGGILSEAVSGPSETGGDGVVIGIGINVALAADELPTPQATSLLVEAFLYEEQTRRGVSLKHWEEFEDVADHCTVCHKCASPCPVKIDFGEVSMNMRNLLRKMGQKSFRPGNALSMAFLNATSPDKINLMRSAMVGVGFKAQRLAHDLLSRLARKQTSAPRSTVGAAPIKEKR